TNLTLCLFEGSSQIVQLSGGGCLFLCGVFPVQQLRMTIRLVCDDDLQFVLTAQKRRVYSAPNSTPDSPTTSSTERARPLSAVRNATESKPVAGVSACRRCSISIFNS